MSQNTTVLARTGSSNADNATVFEIASNAEQFDTWQLGSTGGAMDVFVSGDGTNFLSAAVAMIDLGSTTPSTAVVLTAANGNYAIRGRWKAIRVLQNGVAAVTSAYLIGYNS